LTDKGPKRKRKSLDDITRKKLLYAKQFYVHGEKHTRLKSSVDRMIAIHQFHAAVEIVLKAVYVKYAASEGIKRKKGKGLKHLYFDELLREIKPHCDWITVPIEDYLLNKLNEKRHMAQHEAEPIASEYLPEYQVRTKDFLVECFLNEFGVKFDELDLVDAICDPKLRQVLIWGKELTSSGEYELSVVFSKLVFEIALIGLQELLPYIPDPNYSSSRIENSFRSLRNESTELLSALGKFSDEVARIIDKLAQGMEKVSMLTLVVGEAGNIKDYFRFENTHPKYINWAMNRNDVFYEHKEEATIPEDVIWLRNYVVETLLSLQREGLLIKWGEYWLRLYKWAESQIEAKRKEASK